MKKIFVGALAFFIFSCSKSSGPIQNPHSFSVQSFTVNGEYKGNSYANLKDLNLRFVFSGGAIDKNTVGPSVSLKTFGGLNINLTYSYDNDSTLLVKPTGNLTPITGYRFEITSSLKSQQNAALQNPIALNLFTTIDSTDKFPQISDTAFANPVQQQTFKYFYDFGHPISGMARERNTSAEP